MLITPQLVRKSFLLLLIKQFDSGVRIFVTEAAEMSTTQRE